MGEGLFNFVAFLSCCRECLIYRALDGPNLFINRGDVTDLAFGGNKARKLKFVLTDAEEKEADVVVPAGLIQSNCVCIVGSD